MNGSVQIRKMKKKPAPKNSDEQSTPRHFSHLRNKFVTIVAFGDSITQVNHTTLGGLNWTGYLSMGLYEIFPKGFTIINSGIGGDSMAKGLARLDRDVLRFNPDIVILSFGMNDINDTTSAKFREQLREGVHRIREHGPCTIVLRTPNPMINMWSGQESIESPEQGKLVKRDLASFAKAICTVAKQEKTLLVDHYLLWKESMKSSCSQDLIKIMHDPIHPNSLGHRRLYHELRPVFNASRHFFYEWERILVDQKKLSQ